MGEQDGSRGETRASADARHFANARWRSPLTGGICEKIPPRANVPTPHGARRATTAELIERQSSVWRMELGSVWRMELGPAVRG
jgi:hypothetical protein